MMIGKPIKYCWQIIALMILISSSILCFDIPRIDDTSYIKKNIVDRNIEIEKENSIINNGKNYQEKVSLASSDGCFIELKAKNMNKETVSVDVFLSSPDSGYKSIVKSYSIKPGTHDIIAEFESFREMHPNDVRLNISTSSNNGIKIKQLKTSLYKISDKQNKLIKVCEILCIVCSILSGLFLFVSIIINKNITAAIHIAQKQKNEFFFHLIITLSVIGVLFIIYKGCNINYPISFNNGDECGVYYIVKTIKEYGTTLINKTTGGISGGDMFDYPYSDKLSFILIKIISIFVENVYKITNFFFFLMFVLVANTSFYVCRKLNYDHCLSYVISLVYAFSPYIQHRYAHLWLTAYYMIPIACLISIRIINGTLLDENEKCRNSYWNMLFLSFLCGFTGMYYAFFACALFAIAILISALNQKKLCIRSFFRYFPIIMTCIFAVIVNVVPNVIYMIIFGTNPIGQVLVRSKSESEIYGLKLIQMILPSADHRIEFFGKVANYYTKNFPLVNENATATIGLIAVIGLVLAVINLLGKKQNIFSETLLIVSMFGISTIGGVGACIALCVYLPMRCYNRASIIIMFLALLVVGKYLKAVKDKYGKKGYYILISLMLIIGLFDQTSPFKTIDYSEYKEISDTVKKAEKRLNYGDLVFVLPFAQWPTEPKYVEHSVYLESTKIVSSYGAAEGRDESLWQQSVARLGPVDMVNSLRLSNYRGIFFYPDLYTETYSFDDVQHYIDEITAATGEEPIISKNGKLYFWEI